MRDFGGKALGLTLLVAAAWGMLQAPAATQGRPNYRVDPWWPRPFANQSWVLGSITGVTVDAQNHLWVVHRGGDSLEANEKGMMLTPPPAAVSGQAAPPVVEFEQECLVVGGRGGAGADIAWSLQSGGVAVEDKGTVWIDAVGFETAAVASARGR